MIIPTWLKEVVAMCPTTSHNVSVSSVKRIQNKFRRYFHQSLVDAIFTSIHLTKETQKPWSVICQKIKHQKSSSLFILWAFQSTKCIKKNHQMARPTTSMPSSRVVQERVGNGQRQNGDAIFHWEIDAASLSRAILRIFDAGFFVSSSLLVL